MHRHSTTLCTLLLCFGALSILAVNAQTADTSAKHVKTTDEVYKNIQVLKGIPADQLIPAMQFITASLGVECGFCHVENHFDQDDKKPKETARKMIRMVTALNHDEVFGGKLEVTCNSCHRGARLPVSIPLIKDQPIMPGMAGLESEELAGLPTTSQILGKYVEALGGADAISKITSLVQSGTTTLGNSQTTVEVVDKSPGKRVVITHLPAGDNVTAFDGVEGWTTAPHRPVREMPAADLPGARMDADLQFPLHIEQLFGTLKAGPSEDIGGQSAYQLIGERDGQPTARLYFSRQSGLLLRLLRYSASPLGLNPTRIDYSDYRPLHGVKIPYRWTVAHPFGQFTIQVTEAEANVPVNDQKFQKPIEAEQQSAK